MVQCLVILSVPYMSSTISKRRHFNCQFVISTHSPIFLSLAGALIYDLDSDGVPTRKWTELENVRKYFEFFEEHRDEF